MPDNELIEKQTVLLVDDAPENLALMSSLLKESYKIKMANNGNRALKLALTGNPPDIILLDITMPVMDGYETCRQLKANPATRDIPVIFLTARTQVEDEMHGFELGAVDYITKPISPSIVMARVQTHLQLKRVRDYFKDKNAFLEEEVARRTKEIAAIQEVTILAMSSLAETRDNETGNHIRRTQFYVKILAEKLRLHPRFRHYLDDDKTIELLFKSAPLHDIGKVSIPDAILLKQGKLTPAEFEVIKTHTLVGGHALDTVLQYCDLQMFRIARDLVMSHHERYDGNGYPSGIKGEEIPLAARIMGIADHYDALRSKRVYKEAFTAEEAIQNLREESGKRFDPAVVNVMLAHINLFEEIHDQYAEMEALPEKHAGFL